MTATVQVRDKNGVLLDTLPVDSTNAGEITDDRTAAVRRTISSPIRIVDPTGALFPQYASDILHPYSGNELWCYLNNVLIGVFGLTNPQAHIGNDGRYLELSGSDRSHRIQRALWTDIYPVASGTNLNVAIANLIQNRMTALGVSGWAFNLVPTSYTLPDTTAGLADAFSSTDPWTTAVAWAAENGEELFFDRQGVLVAQLVPDPASTAASKTYIAGHDGVTISIDNGIDVDNSYSGVLVIGSGSDVGAPVNAVVWDPTAKALLGDVPYRYQSSTVQSVAQAQAAAQALLPAVVGAQITLTVNAIPDPALKSSDIVHVTYVDQNYSIDDNVLVQQVQLPLGPTQNMTFTATMQVAP